MFIVRWKYPENVLGIQYRMLQRDMMQPTRNLRSPTDKIILWLISSLHNVVWKYTSMTNDVTPLRIYLQVKRIEEKDQVFSLVVGQWDFLELTIDDCVSFESWRWFLKRWDRHFDLIIYKYRKITENCKLDQVNEFQKVLKDCEIIYVSARMWFINAKSFRREITSTCTQACTNIEWLWRLPDYQTW